MIFGFYLDFQHIGSYIASIFTLLDIDTLTIVVLVFVSPNNSRCGIGGSTLTSEDGLFTSLRFLGFHRDGNKGRLKQYTQRHTGGQRIVSASGWIAGLACVVFTIILPVLSGEKQLLTLTNSCMLYNTYFFKDPFNPFLFVLKPSSIPGIQGCF